MIRAGLPELTAFVAIAEQRSFSGAARMLGVSPSALSHSMRGLESRLELRLFNRTTRSVALTEAGEQLFQRVQPLLGELDCAVNDVTSERNTPSGLIRLSASESSFKLLIRDVMPQFLQDNPQIHIECVVDSRLVDIVADGFDAGIRLFDDVPRDMIAVRFGPDVRFAAVASPDYLSRHPAPHTPQDLKAHRCIRFRFASGTLFRWDLDHEGRSASVDVDGPMTLDNINLMVEAALAGVGIAWVPEHQVDEHLQAGRLVHVLPEWGPCYAGACLYYPANRHPPMALRMFVEAVREWGRG
ncbi:LysR family transcriptional regulator [Pseudomonas poae]|uniref:LysR family transcriptional regulator n=1 Tax=Pseudomonas poae TaxID=200451 RepID=A0A2S9ETB5_9PSED|nr:LysR family transcriptional regulator [Pseudomonas poae]PRA27925.1 LysR family transcriptional regulator [Pseudomonas poae]PRC19029.1 LysR family transcriptional regulator [Pseudomonas poae]